MVNVRKFSHMGSRKLRKETHLQYEIDSKGVKCETPLDCQERKQIAEIFNVVNTFDYPYPAQ